MAVDTQSHSPGPSGNDDATNYDTCLITPMGRDGEPLIELEHLVDAVLVGLLVFFAVILGDVIPTILAGRPAYLTVEEILMRAPTGVVACGLAFIFQWLRARGLDVLEIYRNLNWEK